MNWLIGPPTPAQLKLHETEYSSSINPCPGMITSRVWESGSRVERRVRVKDMFAGSLWLAVDYRLLRPRIVELRLIKGKVHQRDCIEWEELTGDWQTFRYLPLTQSGIPVEYREASDEVD